MNKMCQFDELESLHLEITSRCNASCPMCPRNLSGGPKNPNLPDAEISLEDAKKIFTAEFIGRLKQMYLCGNYGDAMVAQDTLEILRYFRQCNPSINLGIHTNASGRSNEWWRQLASVVNYCQFGIDGLEDTNHIYRRHTVWKSVMASAKAFIEAGGIAEWQFIVFRHNEHQIQDAINLAKTMGFKRFNIVKTTRFFGGKKSKFDVLNQQGQKEYEIEPPRDSNFINEKVIELNNSIFTNMNYEEYLDQTEITCKAVVKKEIYVNSQCHVFPCCYTGHIYTNIENPAWLPFLKLLQFHGGEEIINAKKNSIQNIVNGEFYQVELPKTWALESVGRGKLAVCAIHCGECSPIQSQNSKIKI